MSTNFIATLKRGVTYTYMGVQFQADVPVPVSEEVKDHLEEYAVEAVNVSDGDIIERPRFIFEEAEDDEGTTGRKRPSRTT